MIKGIDVSVFQGLIRWHEVPADVEFVITRVGVVEAGVDANWKTNVRGCRDTGRIWSAYDFLDPKYPVRRQIENLWRALGDENPAIPIALDVEAWAPGLTAQQIVDAIREARDEVLAVQGRLPMIYSYLNYFQRLGQPLERATDLAASPLWLAWYGHGENVTDETKWPDVPLWELPTMVQVSGDKSSRVPGINGAVDHNVYLGDMRSFKRDLCGLPDLAFDDTQPVIHPPIDFIPPEPPEE